MKRKTAQGFTLVELLIVIAILITLGLVGFLVLNPFEVQKKTRDTVRVSDLNSIKSAIEVAAQESTTDAAATLCLAPATVPCTGTSFPTDAATRNSDGTGWVKVNVKTLKTGALPVLPIDPVNNATYNYDYASDGNSFELNANLESTDNTSKMTGDGGNNDNLLEVGSSLTLIN